MVVNTNINEQSHSALIEGREYGIHGKLILVTIGSRASREQNEAADVEVGTAKRLYHCHYIMAFVSRQSIHGTLHFAEYTGCHACAWLCTGWRISSRKHGDTILSLPGEKSSLRSRDFRYSRRISQWQSLKCTKLEWRTKDARRDSSIRYTYTYCTRYSKINR